MAKSTIHKLFRQYSSNLEIVVSGTPQLVMEPKVNNVFMCPICFDKYFPQEAIDENLLSLEHVPPKALGGKVRTLTCTTCNNQAGAILDSQLKKHLEFSEFWQDIPDANLEIRYSVNDSGFLPATLSQSAPGELILAGQPHRSNPKVLETVTENFRTTDPSNLNMKLQIPTFKDRHPQAAILRIAYLYAFSILGYSFLINPNLRVIRGQIRHPSENILPTWGLIQNNNVPDEMIGVNLIVKPKELQSFLVIFDLKTSIGTNSRWSVLLPGPSQPGLSIYQWLSDHQGIKTEHEITHLKDVNFVDEPFAAYHIWNKWR